MVSRFYYILQHITQYQVENNSQTKTTTKTSQSKRRFFHSILLVTFLQKSDKRKVLNCVTDLNRFLTQSRSIFMYKARSHRSDIHPVERYIGGESKLTGGRLII